MAKNYGKNFFTATIAIVFALFSSPAIYAEEGNTQADLVSQNCASIKTHLRALQKNDSKNRVLLGSYYETILNKLMMNLNLRLVKNNLSSAELTEQQNNISSAREDFKSDFVKYSQKLEELISIDCKNEPEKFIKKLEKTRSLRASVKEDIDKIDEILDEHELSVAELYTELSK